MDSVTEQIHRKGMNTRHHDNYLRMNCIVVFNKTKDRVLFCQRRKDPFAGRLNFVGGKDEKGESSEDSAYRELFEETGITRRQIRLCRLADMYHYGNYVDCSYDKCRDILENLMDRLDGERKDPRFWISTLFPEVSLRLVQLNLEEEIDTIDDLDCLLDSREILSVRQQNRPFWGNLKTMRDILETTVMMVGNEYDFIDLYDLMTLEETNAKVTFIYDNEEYLIDIFPDQGEVVYQFGSRWFHGADDFLEKARVNQKRLTTVYHQIRDIKVRK